MGTVWQADDWNEKIYANRTEMTPDEEQQPAADTQVIDFTPRPATPREAAINAANQAIAASKDNTDMAYRLACSAVEIDPTFQEGWYLVGNANNDKGLRAAAVACWRRAVILNPQDAKAWTNLAHQLYNLGQVEESFAAATRALELEPDFAFAHTAMSQVLSVMGNTGLSLQHALQAYAIDSETPEIEFALAFALLYARQWNKGLRHFESKFRYRLKHYERYPMAKWDGSHVKSLHIIADQGLGDTLSYLKFVPQAAERVGELVIHLHPELVRLAATMLSHCPNVLIGPFQVNIPYCEAWDAITSLPYTLALTDDEFEHAAALPIPYNAIAPTVPWKVPGAKLHVGICWAGAPNQEHDIWRSMKLEQFLEFAQVPGVQLYALQFGPRQADVHALGATPVVKDMAPLIRDVQDTVSVIRDLDLVITIESALGHITGVAEVECWTLVSRRGGDYRYGRNEEKPIWYPQTRIFRQGEDMTWEPVIAQVIEALKERIG